MVSKRQKLAALVIAIVVMIAGLALIALIRQTPTEAELLILNPKEVGDGWIGFDMGTSYDEKAPNESSFCYRQVQNSTIGIRLIVYVFASENDSKAAFDRHIDSIQNSTEVGGVSNFSFMHIGDRMGFYEYRGFPQAFLLLGRSMSILWADDDHFNHETWYNQVLIEIATLQSEKIHHHFNG